MIYKRKYLLVFLFIAFCITDCKKYPEGPTISLRTKMARITGVWDVEYYEANGIDSTSYVLSSPCYCRYYFSNSSNKSHPVAYGFSFRNSASPGSCGGDNGWWGWSDKKTSIGLYATLFGGFTPIGAYGNGAIWDIQRLTNKELWLKMNSDNPSYNYAYSHKNYYMKLKKVSEKP